MTFFRYLLSLSAYNLIFMRHCKNMNTKAATGYMEQDRKQDQDKERDQDQDQDVLGSLAKGTGFRVLEH